MFGPAFPLDEGDLADYAGRLGDELGVNVPLITDQGAGRRGSTSMTGTTTLLRDGEVVGETPYVGYGAFEVGPERAEYTVRTVGDREASVRLSTQVSAEWTDASAHVAGEEPEALPLLGVRFAPDLASDNTARAGKRFTFPMSVQRNGVASPGRVSTPTVEVSYDDGTTWQAAKVRRTHGQWDVTVDHPAGARFVSLRSSVADREGNAQELTIVRAYALR